MGIPIEGSGFTLSAPVYPSPCVILGNVGQPYTDIHETSAAQQLALGTQLILPGGRKFRYAKNGGTQLSKALMTSSEANYAQAVNEAQGTSGTNVEVGDYQITIDVATGGTWVENEYAGGFLSIDESTGISDFYEIIANHSVSDLVMQLLLRHPIRTAFAAGTKLTFIKNPWRDVDVMPTTAEGTPTGVPLVTVPANYYCWLQRGGCTPMLVDDGDTIVKGNVVGLGGTDPGAVQAVGADTTLVYGVAVYVAAADKTAIIDLLLD